MIVKIFFFNYGQLFCVLNKGRDFRRYKLMDNDILKFIQPCIKRRRILWTYHVNIRLKGRFISREVIMSSVDTFEIIEKYPMDRYLPSYLLYAKHKKQIIHIQIAVNFENEIITIVTAYKPTSDKWEKDFKTRRRNDLS